MARVLAIDYGKKRTGLAVTDPFQIISTALTTVDTKDLINFLKGYFAQEKVETAVIGLPKNLNGTATDGTTIVEEFLPIFKSNFPDIPLHTYDERFTSKIALRSMIDSGMKKKDRRVKGNVDKVSATIILQDFLNSQR